MSEKVIIVRRKKKKDKGKKKKKPKTKATMEQKVSQNVKVIINERARPRRNRALAVKGYNTPRLSIQPPTIIHKGLDAESALNSFRNIYDTRVRALERGLNGVNGNITNLTSQLQNNRPPPLNTPQPPGTTPFISDEEGQRILDQRLAPAQNIEVEQAEPEVKKQKRRVYSQEEKEERARLKIIEKGQRSLEYTEERIRDADGQEVQGMILSLGEEEGDKYFDNFGGIKKGQLTQAKSFVRNVVKRNRQERLSTKPDYKGGKNLKLNLDRNL